MATKILGIRHHGPGSAIKVKKYLETHPPDIILIEGPPEAGEIIQYARIGDMQPPVALLLYDKKEPRIASFYPFAVFSPEWQAIQFGLQHDIPVRFMDMPAAHGLAIKEEEKQKECIPIGTEEEPSNPEETPITYPLDYLARIAGYENTDLWWEHQFELHSEEDVHFEAVMEAISALRETDLDYHPPQNDVREAFMRSILYKAEAEFENVTVICGAWHGPALLADQRPKKKEDAALMKGLPKTGIEKTWIPWTYERLAFESGYGAGIFSPGWYEHVWNSALSERNKTWMIKVARVLRAHQMDISTAHVIEGVRLADSLAALRNLSQPGLDEFNEATSTVLSFGDDTFLQLVRKELIVGNKMGAVPDETPVIPLQQDLQDNIKSLRLKQTDEYKTQTLDLRKDLDLRRSIFFHRLDILGIDWAKKEYVAGKGTFKEAWNIRWQPDLVLKTVEMGIWGNTVTQACHSYLVHLSEESPSLTTTVKLLNKALPADLNEAAERLIQKVDEQAAVSGDVFQLMSAFPTLVNISRYGDVRKTDVEVLVQVLDSISSRINIGLANACTSLDEESALETITSITEVDQAFHVYNDENYLESWYNSLMDMADTDQIAPAISGKACRLLSDHRIIEKEGISKGLSIALSYGREVAYSANWLEGFLHGNSIILLLEDEIWEVLNEWIAHLDRDDFINYLPVLRRSFSLLSSTERRKLGERAKQKGKTAKVHFATADFDHERGMKSLHTIAKILTLNGR